MLVVPFNRLSAGALGVDVAVLWFSAKRVLVEPERRISMGVLAATVSPSLAIWVSVAVLLPLPASTSVAVTA